MTTSRPGQEVEVFFDGACPLCRREISLLRKMDGKGRIAFTDIASPDFDPASTGRTRDELMAQLHARLPDGRVIAGVEVFRRLYAAVGFRTLVWVSRLPLVSWALDAGYGWFAKNRLRLTGRCDDGTCAVART